jgi:hypothetical protein
MDFSDAVWVLKTNQSQEKPMDETIIATYCLRERSFNRTKPSKRSLSQMSDAFVMTTAIVAALYFGGNYQRARQLLFEQNYIPKMLSLSRFSRRAEKPTMHHCWQVCLYTGLNPCF